MEASYAQAGLIKSIFSYGRNEYELTRRNVLDNVEALAEMLGVTVLIPVAAEPGFTASYGGQPVKLALTFEQRQKLEDAYQHRRLAEALTPDQKELAARALAAWVAEVKAGTGRDVPRACAWTIPGLINTQMVSYDSETGYEYEEQQLNWPPPWALAGLFLTGHPFVIRSRPE